jgi:translation initiation factor IF-1
MGKKDRDDRIELEGVVIEVLPQTNFRVQCGKSIVLCGLSGKLRQNHIRILEGDKVRIEVSPYDLTRGRCTRRL